MRRENSSAAISKIMFQGCSDRTESKLAPWNFVFAKKACVQAFWSGVQIFAQDPCQIKEVHLFGVRDVNNGVQITELDLRACFFLCFAHGALRRRFAQFHKPGRQGPFIVSGFYGPAAQQDFVFPDRQHADDVARILIMHSATVIAHVPHAIVIRRYTLRNRRATLAAEFLRARGWEVEIGSLRGHAVILTFWIPLEAQRFRDRGTCAKVQGYPCAVLCPFYVYAFFWLRIVLKQID